MMILIAVLACGFALADAISWGISLLLLLLLLFGAGLFYGAIRDRRAGGTGIFGATVAGMIMGTGIVVVSMALLFLFDRDSLDADGVLGSLLAGAVGGGFVGMIGGVVASFVLVLSGIDSGVQPHIDHHLDVAHSSTSPIASPGPTDVPH